MSKKSKGSKNDAKNRRSGAAARLFNGQDTNNYFYVNDLSSYFDKVKLYCDLFYFIISNISFI